MARVALLSNPRSTGNRSLLPRVRSFCAEHQDIFHYEVERVDQVGDALKTIARVQPTVLVINGGDGTVQAALTEIFNGGYFGDNPPPVAVLPNGKTNLIAHDLGASGDPILALERVLEIARSDLDTHIVRRELIELSGGTADGKPVLGMFLGGAGLADTMLYCRHKIYPLGLPNGIAHFIALMLGLFSAAGGKRISVGPMRSNPLRVSVLKQGEINGQFSVLLVTTLQRLLFGTQMSASSTRLGAMQLVLIDRSILALLRALTAGILGKLGRIRVSGVHLERGDEIHIQGEQSNVILDGELFSADPGQPIVLKPTSPVPFLRLAA
ncbi:diacylglycerol kinase family protein [Sphingosinicella sp. BN140058]|uniref:diacylglycerol/lipid kinase family protein n=1 Tax=Sphingosinicella sp. BN140058 TaxID=1892855 RepID=UPI001012E3E7|nr:diacylglycerol kinase family protein [Sphingosinicella sp. BN140058]QAY78004.1 diacylglycerol kinase [Sphingosinicella sp. BN140058]